jgi:hypothetical protein
LYQLIPRTTIQPSGEHDMIKYETENYEELVVASLQETALYITHFQECKDFQEYKELASLPTRNIDETERMVKILENAMLQGNDELVEAINNFEDLILQEAETLPKHEFSSCVEYQTVIIDFLKSPKTLEKRAYIYLDMPGLGDYKENNTFLGRDIAILNESLQISSLRQVRRVMVLGATCCGKNNAINCLLGENLLQQEVGVFCHRIQRESILTREEKKDFVLFHFSGHGSIKNVSPFVESFHSLVSSSQQAKMINRCTRWINIATPAAWMEKTSTMSSEPLHRIQLEIAQSISWTEKTCKEWIKSVARGFLREKLMGVLGGLRASDLENSDIDLKLLMDRKQQFTTIKGRQRIFLQSLSSPIAHSQVDNSSTEAKKYLWAAHLVSFQKYCTLKTTGDVDMLSSSVNSCNVQSLTSESNNSLFEEYRSLAVLESRELEDSERMLTILEEAMNNGDDELVNQINALEDELSKNTALTPEEEYQCKPHQRQVQTFLSNHMKQSTAQDSSAIRLMDLLGIEDYVFHRINIQKLGELIDSSVNQSHRCSSGILFPQRLSIRTLSHVYVAKVIKKSQWRCRSILISSIVAARDDRKKESMILGVSSSFYRQEMEDIKMEFSASLEDVYNQIISIQNVVNSKDRRKCLLSRKEEFQSKLDKIFEEFMQCLDSQYEAPIHENGNISQKLMKYYKQEFTRLYGDLVVAFAKIMCAGSIEFRDSLPDTKPICLRLLFPPTEIEIPSMNNPDEYETSRWEEVSQIFRKLNLISDFNPPPNLVNVKQAERSNQALDHL